VLAEQCIADEDEQCLAALRDSLPHADIISCVREYVYLWNARARVRRVADSLSKM